jgi:uroporphyrinogen III methyltransferase/synthase
MATGKVYLVGAGPGDPGLLTLKGKWCLEVADVVIYDALVNPALLSYARPGATIINAGKREGDHKLPQEEINALLVDHAGEGRTVTRLKGGDPFIFGRGGEEAETLALEGIPFEVVPGVSAGIAVPAYAGIPLTHRELTADVTFLAGHRCEGASIEWERIAPGNGTLVFFMGLRSLPTIAGRLIAHGRDPRTPVAVIQWGTTDRQVTVAGALEEIVEQVARAGLEPPALVVVGEVVRLRNLLGWFGERRVNEEETLFSTGAASGCFRGMVP